MLSSYRSPGCRISRVVVKIEHRVEDYLEYLKNVKRRSEGTIKQYRSILKNFSEFSLTEEGFHDYLRSISRNSPRTQQLKIVTVKGYLNWLYDRGKISGKRFWLEAEPPREKALPHYLTMEELRRFFEAIDDPYFRSIFRLLVNTGMRISELYNMKSSDITFSGDRARIRIRGKGSKERVVQVKREIAEDALKSGVFDRRVSVRTIQRRMKRYLKKAGIDKKLTPHSLRHTFAIILMENGVPLNRIQAILGHESIATTSIYLKVLAEGESLPEII